MSLTFRKQKDDSGAIAVMYALLVAVLIGLAALGTDLGNAISRKTSNQAQADFAAYDAGQMLTSSARPGMALPQALVDRVRDSLNNNQPQNDGESCADTDPATCVTSDMLTDTNLKNGQLRVTSRGLQVIAPESRVHFGLAGIFNRGDTTVLTDATVNVFSAGRGVFPMFAVSGCDYGRQTLTDPAHGHTSGAPNLVLADNGQADLAELTVRNATYQQVDTVPLNATGHSVWVTASNWNSTSAIGFSKDDGVASEISTTLNSTSTHTPLVPIPVTSNTVMIEVPIPASVTASEGVWYVTAMSGSNANNSKWSPADEAKPFRVGQSVLECTAGSNGGNFGTLRLPRTDGSTSNDVQLNIAKGLQSPLNLVVHQWGRAQMSNTTWDGKCTDGDEGAVVSSGSNLRDDTNCVDTDPGLPANVATQGFVTGVKAGNTLLAPGLLNQDSLCDASGGTARTPPVTIQGDTYTLNNDVLSCFLTGGKSLGDIASPSYNQGAALTPAILKSPRFGFVPIVAREPDTGSSSTYSIVDFRAAFITDEVPGAGATKGSHTGTTDNGLYFSGNDLTQIKVVYFNIDALPRDGELPLIEFLGIGRPIVHLVD